MFDTLKGALGVGETWVEYRSLNDHGRLVNKSNQNPVSDVKYLSAISLMSSQYVSEMSKVPVKNGTRTSICTHQIPQYKALQNLNGHHC